MMENTLQATVNGVNVPVSTIETDHPYKDINQWCADASMEWAAFDVTFPAGKDVLIRINFSLIESARDVIFSFQYTLETGAAWKGPIGTAYIVVRFPYLATPDTILDDTTSGYQILYNEIFWSYRDFEPTHANNMTFAFVSPEQWQSIKNERDRVHQDRTNVDAWLQLAQLYSSVAYIGKADVRDFGYRQKVFNTYAQAITANPDNANLYAAYADFLFYDCCFYHYADGIDEANANRILTLVDKALKLDPSNETALEIIDQMEGAVEGFTYERPVTFTPTITPTLTETPTPTITATPRLVEPTRTDTEPPTLPPTYTPLPSHTKLPEANRSPTKSVEIKAPTISLARPEATDTREPSPSLTAPPALAVTLTQTDVEGNTNQNTGIFLTSIAFAIILITVLYRLLRKRGTNM
jgi:hypothetical protein